MGLKLNTASSGSVTLEPANTASNYTLTVPAQTGTIATTVDAGNYYAFKNRIINGNMAIDQRNAGASVTPNNSYTLDRWSVYNTQTSKLTVQQNAGSVTPPVGFKNYLGVTSTSSYSVLSTDYFVLSQSIEGLNIADFAWGTSAAVPITISFYVRSSLTGTFGLRVCNSDGTRAYLATYTINNANTWEQKSVTIAGETSGNWLTTNGIGVTLQFSLGVGSASSSTAGSWLSANFIAPTGATSVVGTSGATFYITGVQLEKGSTATNYDVRSYGTELQLCQRYYWKGTWFGGACADDDYSVNALGGCFPVTMRTNPTITIISGGMAGHHSIAPDSTWGTSQDSVGFSWSGSGYRSIGARGNVAFTSSAEL